MFASVVTEPRMKEFTFGAFDAAARRPLHALTFNYFGFYLEALTKVSYSLQAP
jgi:hypothetical protein